MKFELHIDNRDEGDPQSPVPIGDWKLFEPVLAEELKALCPDIVRFETVEVSVTLMTPDGIRAVNREYRDEDEPTDVLSFPLWEEDGTFAPDPMMTEAPLSLGDVLICPEETASHHPALSPEAGFCLVLAHSFLHLLAWDHDTEEREAAMWERQNALADRLLKALEVR